MVKDALLLTLAGQQQAFNNASAGTKMKLPRREKKDKLAPGLNCSVLIGADDEKEFCPVCCRKLSLSAEPKFVTLEIDGNR